MSWKDDYREQKEASGLTWDQFVDRQLVHVDELESGARAIEDLIYCVRFSVGCA